MAKSRNDKPSVATYADYEVITPPNPLRKAASTVADNDPADDPVTRAEQALAGLASEFSSWMDEECSRIDAARRAVRAKGFSRATREALFHAAHDIKGEAATFGFPLVVASADSLCRLIELTPDMQRIPLALVEQHVDAIRAIVRENARPDVEEMAVALTRRLREVTDDFLRQENRDRPDVLEEILAPPLAPGQHS
jgi:HPt (histidine-containing phosphotransfer) domain-containing protein